jgi:translation initiation factor 2B subunit (eIF-2B alpha/beta/delta family)
LVFDLFRRRSTGRLAAFKREVRELASRLAYIDLHGIGAHTATLILDSLKRLRGSSQEEESRIILDISEFIRETLPYSMQALFISDLLKVIGETSERPIEAARRALTLLLDYHANASNALAVNLSKEIKYGSSITLFGYSESTLKIILAVSGKLSRIHVISYWPLMTGRKVAVALRRRGVNISLWPDSSASQALEESDYLVAASLGVTGDGVIIGEAGMHPLLVLAEYQSRESFVLASAWGFRPSAPKNIGIVERMPHPVESDVELTMSILDVAPLTKASTLITESGVYKRPRPEGVVEIYRGLLKSILENVTQEKSPTP